MMFWFSRGSRQPDGKDERDTCRVYVHSRTPLYAFIFPSSLNTLDHLERRRCFEKYHYNLSESADAEKQIVCHRSVLLSC